VDRVEVAEPARAVLVEVDEAPAPELVHLHLAHDDIQIHRTLAAQADPPIAALLQDLKASGMLKDTLVVIGGEFGRTPFNEKGDGRDHNPWGFTMWMAGGGVRAGTVVGETDEIGLRAVRSRAHVHDIHATILHLLGMDHEKLTYRYAGRNFRLTDVEGKVVKDIVA